MNEIHAIIIITAVFVSLGIIALMMGEHDQRIEIEQDIKSASCKYLKQFLIEEEPKYFKHPWYDLAMKKVNSAECIDK